MGQTQSLQQTQTPTQASLAAPTSIKAKRITKKPQPYATSFFEAQMLDSPDVSMRRVKNTAPNYFEFASATPQPIRKTSSAYNVHTSSTSASAKTSSTTSSVKKIYPGQRSLSLSTVPSTKDGEDLSEISTSFTLDKNYITINNRRYWKDKNNQMQFILPCDDDESDRLMSLHYILKSVFGGNFISPIKDVLSNNESIDTHARPKVLDIGCGSGTWILEMATEYPNSDFYGIDQCPLFPVSIKPSNSYFQLHEIPNTLPFEDGSFDFVFMRMVVLHLHPDKVVSLVKEVSRILKPGGYFEVVDTDYIIRRSGHNSSMQINEQVIKLFCHSDFSSLLHENSTIHPLFSQIMLSCQMTDTQVLPFYGEFVEINQHQTGIGLGGDGERLGKIYAENHQLFLSSVAKRNDETALFSNEDLNQIMKECRDYESYVDWFICFARKPLLQDDDGGDDNEEILVSSMAQSSLDSIYEFVDGFDDETSIIHQ